MYNIGAYHDIVYSEHNLKTFTRWIDQNHPEITKNFKKDNNLYKLEDVKTMTDILSNVEKFQLRGFIANSHTVLTDLPKSILAKDAS